MRQLMVSFVLLGGGCLLTATSACAQQRPEKRLPQKTTPAPSEESSVSDQKLKTATFGGGCFWCVEAVFENVRGVADVVAGYAGGEVENPTYQQICTGRTGHAEVCEIKYDPEVIGYRELLEIFWKTHDPTTLNRQGNDIGPQYRSVIFYHDDEQRELAERIKQKLDESGAFQSKIVTEIAPAPTFYVAEEYHQDYYRKNPGAGYCVAIVRPKLEKFKQAFADKLDTQTPDSK